MASITLLAAACAPAPRAPQDEAPDLEKIYAANTGRHEFVPDPSFVPVRPAIDVRRSALRQEGEIIVIEGDSRTVTSNGGAHGIDDSNRVAIVQDVLAMYPDEFDTIQIYLSFLDAASPGAAYYSSISNSVAGIGLDTFNGRAGYGLGPDGRLSGFSNMNDMLMWGSFNQLTRPEGSYYAVIAQELSHRWLMKLRFNDAAGAVSSAFLGRQEAHWSALVHAYGSCQDGVFWEDNGDGTFTHMGESDRGWAPVDQYAMGIRAAGEVEPWFYLTEASLNGMMLGRESHRDIPRLARVQANRIDVDVDAVIGALGPRNPPAGTETPYYRAAFVLVTAPGQQESEWRPYLEALQEVGRTFPDTWKTWTSGKGALCTKVSERCPEPVIGLQSYTVTDGNDDALAPGESFQLALSVRNDGLGTTRDLAVSIEPIGAGLTVQTQGAITVPALAEGEILALPSAFQLTVGADVECGGVVRMLVRSVTQEGPEFTSTIELPVGTRTLKVDRLNEGPDWTVNPDFGDTAEKGAWALDRPEFVSLLGVVTQPADDHSPGDAKLAFMTGPTKGDGFSANDVDNGVTTLESPVFAIGDSIDPTLVFYAWRVAIDFTAQPPAPVEGADLVVSASNDGGRTWTEMTRFSEQTEDWTRVSLRIKDAIEPTNRTRFRFAIADESLSGTVEAGIDDLEIIDYLAACERPMEMPDAGQRPINGTREEGCSCDVQPGRPGGALALALLPLLLLLRRRAR